MAGTSRVTYGAPPLNLALLPNLPSGVSKIQAEAAALMAAEAWVAPACASAAISFEGTTLIEAAPGDGLNTIQWVSDWKTRHLPADAAATTDVQYVQGASGGWEIAEADIYLNAAMEWTAEDNISSDASASQERRDLRAVLTHEFGHALGLLHPCEIGGKAGAPACGEEQEGACMHPVYAPSQRSLGDDDVAGLCFLYPATSCEETGCANGFGCTSSGCRLLCGEQTCAENELCTARGCVATGECVESGCTGGKCAADADCAVGEVCSSGNCEREGVRAPGDPCALASDCTDGACLDGTCTAACSATVACPRHATCDLEAAACRDELKALGDACDSADDCRGGYCLQERRDPAVCTRLCGGENPACPPEWGCERVESENVCVPEHLAVSGGAGCGVAVSSLAPSGRRSERSWLTVCLGVALSLTHRRRLRRSRVHSICSKHGIPS